MTNRIHAKLILLFLIFSFHLNSEKLGSIPDIFSPSMILVESGRFYITEKYCLSVYSLNPFKLLFKIGKKGEGPQEFKMPPIVNVCNDKILLFTPYKLALFEKNGGFIRENKIDNFGTFIKGLFLIKSQFVFHNIRIGGRCHEFVLTDDSLKKIKTISKICSKKPLPIGKVNLIEGRPNVRVKDNLIFISNPQMGFKIDIFMKDGTFVRKISKEYKKIPIGNIYKKMAIKKFLENNYSDSQIKIIKKKIKFVFDDYFPPIKKMFIIDKSIIILNYETIDDTIKAIILDLNGNVQKELFLPISKWYCFATGQYYFLKLNSDDEFEVHRQKI